MNRARMLAATGLLGLLAFAGPARADGVLLNPSAEQPDATGSAPLGWTPEIWGDAQGTLTWGSDAHSGKRALRVALTAAGAEGDARWFSAPVALTGATSYRVTAYYRCDQPARLVVQALGAGHAPQWMDVAEVGATSTWKQAAGDVVLPLWANQLRVAFLLEAVGTLETDTYGLAPTPPLPPPQDGSKNVLSNPSFELKEADNPAMPADWAFETWGGAEGVGTLVDGDAADGARFVRAELSVTAPDSDVKWWSAPVRVIPGEGDWLLSVRTRGTTKALLGLRLIHADGPDTWLLLKWAPTSEKWQTTSVAFALPKDAQAVRAAAIVNVPGTIDLDAFSLQRVAASGDPKGPLRVSVTVDAPYGLLDNALKVLRAKGIRGSLYTPSGRLQKVGSTTTATLAEAEFSGQEIGVFAEDPTEWVATSGSEWRAMVIRAFSQFNTRGLHPVGFAPPGGLFDDGVVDVVDAAGGYLRTLGNGGNFPPFDYLKIKVRNIDPKVSAAQLEAWADETRRHDGWLVLRYEGVGPGKVVDVERFGADIDLLKKAGASFLPVGEVVGLWSPPERPEEVTGVFGCAAAPVSASGRPPVWLLFLVLAAWRCIAARGRFRSARPGAVSRQR